MGYRLCYTERTRTFVLFTNMRTFKRTYRYRMAPTAAQEQQLLQFAGARRWVWNWALARRKAHYAQTSKGLSVTQLGAELVMLKSEPATAWLAEVDSQALQQAIRDLDQAFGAFFAKRARFPRFKANKGDVPSFRIPQRVTLAGGYVSIPKIGRVKIIQHRPPEGTLKSATFKRDTLGRWWVTLVAHIAMPDVALPPPDPARTVGVDVGLKDFAVTSDGERIPIPRFYRRAERKLRRLQRAYSRTRQGSAGRERARNRVARQYAKVASRRRDFLHKASISLVRRADAVCIEDLAVRGLARTKLSKSVLDASWSSFRFMLTYKAEWYRRHLAVIGRFYPSSRLCGQCGAINADLTLADREWTCACGATHDRDLNAARNIRHEGLRLLLAGGSPESQNASGGPVRPATAGASR
jgi:putative transposase